MLSYFIFSIAVLSESKKIAILGSTGSIGCSTLEVVRSNPQSLSVFSLSAGANVELLAEQIREFRPEVVSVSCAEAASRLSGLVSGLEYELFVGESAVSDVASLSEVDIVMAGVVGFCGLRAVFAASKRGKKIALANKEALVFGRRDFARGGISLGCGVNTS